MAGARAGSVSPGRRGQHCRDSKTGAAQIVTQEISCAGALDDCQLNASNNPGSSWLCAWNGVEIHRAERRAGDCDGLLACP
jgi:hypothetical protein